LEETERAVKAGFEALDAFTDKARKASRDILTWCATNQKPCILVLARPYHMDTGIGHESKATCRLTAIRFSGCNIFPAMKTYELAVSKPTPRKENQESFDIQLWTSSYSSNTNEIMWARKLRHLPLVTCVVRLSSSECGRTSRLTRHTENRGSDRNTVLQVRRPGFNETGRRYQDRIETIVHYMQKYGNKIMRQK